MIMHKNTLDRRGPRTQEIIELARQVEDWHKAPKSDSKPREVYETPSIQWKRCDSTYTGEYRNRQGGRYQFKITQRRNEDHIPGRNTVIVEEHYLLEMEKDNKSETLGSPQKEIKFLYDKAKRIGSRTQSLLEVA